MRTGNRYVVVGSAPYINKYWPLVQDYYFDNGFSPVVLNNAWVMFQDSPAFEWMFPADFLGAGPIRPNAAQLRWLRQQPMRGMLEGGIIKGYKQSVSSCGGTMSLNALHILFNRHAQDPDLLVVMTGSDFQYGPGDNAFYGKGAPDPLRMGEGWLDTELEHVLDRYEKKGFRLEVDTPGMTRLPFGHFTKIPMDCSDKALDLRNSSELVDRTYPGGMQHGMVFRYMRVLLTNSSLKVVSDKDLYFRDLRYLILPGGFLEVHGDDRECAVEEASKRGFVVLDESSEHTSMAFRVR
jgi:hypothetical protein